MRKIPLLCLALFFACAINSQVGINTSNPQGILHIDPQKNTLSDGSNSIDDILVTNTGRIGIGTISPEAMLHITTAGTKKAPISGFRLEDGNQGDGKLLSVINDNGLATWMVQTPVDAVLFDTPKDNPFLGLPSDNYFKTNSTIDLGPGRWVVMVVMYIITLKPPISDHTCWINSTFAEESTIANNGQILSKVSSPDIEGSTTIPVVAWAGGAGAILSGNIIINNKSNQVKRYYYMMGGSSIYDLPSGITVWSPGGHWGEDNIVAFQIPSDI